MWQASWKCQEQYHSSPSCHNKACDARPGSSDHDLRPFHLVQYVFWSLRWIYSDFKFLGNLRYSPQSENSIYTKRLSKNTPHIFIWLWVFHEDAQNGLTYYFAPPIRVHRWIFNTIAFETGNDKCSRKIRSPSLTSNSSLHHCTYIRIPEMLLHIRYADILENAYMVLHAAPFRRNSLQGSGLKHHSEVLTRHVPLRRHDIDCLVFLPLDGSSSVPWRSR